mgnify:CR=1 FL=1
MDFQSILAAATGDHGAVNPWAAIAYLVSGVFFILALRGLSSPSSSQRGNRFGMLDSLADGGKGKAQLGHKHRHRQEHAAAQRSVAQLVNQHPVGLIAWKSVRMASCCLCLRAGLKK